MLGLLYCNEFKLLEECPHAHTVRKGKNEAGKRLIIVKADKNW